MAHALEPSVSSTLSDATAIDSPQSSTFTDGSVELPAIIPPPNPARYRTLVLCFDGTGDQFDNDNSNIVEFFTMLKKDNRDEQMVYYQAGIGTYTSPQVATPLAAKISKTLDEMVAWNLSAHVMDGYEFLMQNYKAGDRISIFGFSRGAYTARSLAGMLHKVGLLPACNHQQVPFAYKMYTRADEVGWKQSNAFKRAFSVDVSIDFIGVWDTVNSVGLIPRRLPFTTSNTIVRSFRHAVSLDERRAKFKANLWNRPDHKEAALGIHSQPPVQVAPSNAAGKASLTRDVAKLVTKAGAEVTTLATGAAGTVTKGLKPRHQERELRAMETKYGLKAHSETNVLEVWFAGCHCDVGGGSVDNDTPYSLARIALRWMVRECFKTETGIMFKSADIYNIGLDPATLYPYVRPRPAPLPVLESRIQDIPRGPPLVHYGETDDAARVPKSEEEHDLLDAMSPIYDQLNIAKGWWLLEAFPIKHRYQLSNNDWETTYWPNLGQGRYIPGQKRRKIYVHRTVKMRMEAQYDNGHKYVPKASFQSALDDGNLEWVD